MATSVIQVTLKNGDDVNLFEATLQQAKDGLELALLVQTDCDMRGDAYAMGWAANKNGVDVDKAEWYSRHHKTELDAKVRWARKAHEIEQYINYLENGGDVGNPFWSE